MNQLIVQKLLGREATQAEAPTILGDLGVICSFGAGYSIGNLLVRKLN